jgi:hypothetical protein
MRCPKALVGRKVSPRLRFVGFRPSRQCGAGYANVQRARKGKGIAPLSRFWRCLLYYLP